MNPVLVFTLSLLAASVTVWSAGSGTEISPATSPLPPPATPGGSVLTRIHVELPVQPFEQYVLDSDEIVRGLVTGQRPVFPANGLAYTEVDVWVVSAVKGTSHRMLHVRVGGATEGERRVEVVGAPRFFEGEEALLFLMRFDDPTSGEEFYGIRGLEHGTYRLRADQTGAPGVRGLHASGEESLIALEARIRAVQSRPVRQPAKEPR